MKGNKIRIAVLGVLGEFLAKADSARLHGKSTWESWSLPRRTFCCLTQYPFISHWRERNRVQKPVDNVLLKMWHRIYKVKGSKFKF